MTITGPQLQRMLDRAIEDNEGYDPIITNKADVGGFSFRIEARASSKRVLTNGSWRKRPQSAGFDVYVLNEVGGDDKGAVDCERFVKDLHNLEGDLSIH